ncbi:MAG: hypothetical protein PHT54_01195 [Candidatus Nanoarchaeia archaeon]|nr:hypothetical protein [Candidatus Nanoarchaeia archaeon]
MELPQKRILMFEGADRAGKDTHLPLVHDSLKENGLEPVIFEIPADLKKELRTCSPLERLREYLTHNIFMMQQIDFYLGENQKNIALINRFYPSTLAGHNLNGIIRKHFNLTNGNNLEDLPYIQKQITPVLRPEALTILITCNPEELKKRFSDIEPLHRYESVDISIDHQEEFKRLNNKGVFGDTVLIDSSGSIKSTFNKIKSELTQYGFNL